MDLKERLGYACINVELQGLKIKTSRTIRKEKFQNDKNLILVSELALQNVKDLREVIRWNAKNKIYFYRITSNLFPWWSEYKLEDLPDFKVIRDILADIGHLAKGTNQRLTFHPGHFTILASIKPSVVNLAMIELEQHSKVFDLMGFHPSTWNKINIHIGTAQGGLEETANRWIRNFNKLSTNCKSRITLENDDKPNMWSVQNLYDLIYTQTNVPIVMDMHHHRVGARSGLSEEHALNLAMSTWKDISPVIHFSSSRRDFEDPKSKTVAHADFIHESLIAHSEKDIWIMIEAKMKEQAVLKYRGMF